MRFHRVGVAVLACALLTEGASAQVRANVTAPPGATARDGREPARRPLVLPDARSLPPLAASRQDTSKVRRDSVWNGALIGAGIGGGGGYIWARNLCGTHDDECFAIAGPAGILTGIGIGAAVGAVADALHK
jgi:hypothetical protein